jgi:hypothetical protein
MVHLLLLRLRLRQRLEVLGAPIGRRVGKIGVAGAVVVSKM